MDLIARQVAIARRRLMAQGFLDAAGWCVGVGLTLALVPLALGRFWPLGLVGWAWLAIGAGAGVLVALGWSLAKVAGRLDSALAIDRRFGLKERVSSAMGLDEAQRSTPAGEALWADANSRIARIDVAGQFGVRARRSMLWPLVPLGLAAVVLWGLEGRGGQATPAGKTALEPAGAVKKSVEPLQRKLEEERKLAQDRGLRDAEQVFDRLQQVARDASAKLERKEALLKLRDLAQELQERRAALGGLEQVRRELSGMRDLGQGPADKLARALSQGGFDQASEELKRLAEQLRKANLTEQERAALARQLAEMQKKLGQLAESHREAVEALKKQIQQAAKSGQAEEAGRLQQQLDKLLSQLPQIAQSESLAKQLGQCSKCLQEGKGAEALSALAEMQSKLDQIERDAAELEMLDDSLKQLAQTRDQMTCPKCGGQGCAACQGQGDGLGEGDGLGKGPGAGARPERKTDTAAYDTQVRQKIGPGAASVTEMVNAPNAKGDVRQQIQAATEAVRQGSVDPLAERRMPKAEREHAREYFDRIRKGE